jgi:Methylamine utilisation protein MauE
VSRLGQLPCLAVVGIVAGVIVGLALVWAGVLKLIVGPTWPKQAADMGVSRPVAQVVPFVEIVIGATLAAQLFTPWPAIAATALLVVFTVVIVRRLLDGSRPPCACFGSRSQRPLGAYHVARNLGLLALAVVAAIWA